MQNRNRPAQTGARRQPTEPAQRPRSTRPAQRPTAYRDDPRSYSQRTSNGQRRPAGSVQNAGRRPAYSSAGRPTDGRPRSGYAAASRQGPKGSVRPGNSSGQRRPNAPQKKIRRRPKFSLFAFVVFLALAGIAAYVINFISIIGIGEPRFVDNVFVNDLSFAGMTHEEGLAEAAAIENEWLNTTYTLDYQGREWDFSRATFGADIDYESQLDYAWNLGQVGNAFQRKSRIEKLRELPIYLEAKISYDESKLDAFVDQICSEIDVAAVDAVVVPDVSAPIVVTESSTGLKVNRELLREQLVALIETGEIDTAIPVDTVIPNIPSDAVSFQTIAQFSTNTDFRGSSSLSNVRLALNSFNGLTVLPGQRVSFNDVVGPRTEDNGFKKATEYAGDTTTMDWGGGVCQASTTLYNALIMANMTIVERHQHSMTVTYTDPSCDAAVFYGTKDLVFENNTDYPIYIYTSVTKEYATVTIYGRQPEYFYHLESVTVEKGIESTRNVYIDDTSGAHVYYVDDPPVLQAKGKDGCITQGWIVAYDWETKEEVSRVQVSSDHYKPGASTYYRGVHQRQTITNAY